MTKIIISCKETDEKRIFENCQTLVDNLPWFHEKVGEFSGDWQTSNNSILISIPSKEFFHELTYAIELFELPTSIKKHLIIVSVNSEVIATFEKTDALDEKWKDITIEVQLRGGKVIENKFEFKNHLNASAFVEEFTNKFPV